MCEKLINFIINLEPTPDFLSDIAAFEGILIGVSIPISLQVVTWVVDRYSDQEIAQFFIKEPLYRSQYLLFLPSIIIAILLRFLNISNSLILLLIFFWMVINIFIFYKFIRLVEQYAANTDKLLLRKLKHYVEDILTKNSTIKERKRIFFFSLEKIVNIALAKTEKRDNESVKEILKELQHIFQKFWQLKKDNPDKFETYLWSDDFYERYVVSKQTQKSETNSPPKNAEDLKREAAFRLSFFPERELKGLTQFLDSYKKIWQLAKQKRNEEISRYVVYQLINLLSELVQEQDNQLFVEQFLRLLNSIAYIGIKNAKQGGVDIDPSLHSATIYWYTDIVFDRLSKNKNFDLSYLELFDKYFFSSVKYIISENQTSLFNALVSSLVDGVLIPNYYGGEVWNYGYLVLNKDLQKYKQLDLKYDITKRIEELINSENDLYTKEKLESLLKKFDELKAIIEPNLDEEQRKEAQKIEKKIREFAITQFKYQNLLEIIFAIGAYCLFKQRYGYIKYLWEYKQPPDSDASWVGHDITPQTLEGVIQFYFRKGLFERKFNFWEGHHGSEIYYKQYFLLLLARILQGISADTEGRYSQIENFKLPDLHIYILSNLEYSIDNFVKLAVDLKQNTDMLAKIGFDTTKLDETFDAKLVPFLKKIKEEANNQISEKHKSGNISQKRVEEFKKKVLKSFYDSANLRDIFIKYFKAYEDKTKEKILGKKERFGISIVDDKASFFDEWYVDYFGWGEDYGIDLASGENSHLLDEIAKDCQEVSREDFEATLSKFKNPKDIVIFATNISSWQVFENFKKFKPKWYRDVEQLEVKGFGGWYDFNGQLIPIFETYHHKIEKQVLILNKNKIGKLIQLSPLNEEEDENLVKDIFYINVQAFSENNDLMEQFIKNPPEWLKMIGDQQKQREHLQKCVLIHIFERFEYNKPKDFEGYKLFLKE